MACLYNCVIHGNQHKEGSEACVLFQPHVDGPAFVGSASASYGRVNLILILIRIWSCKMQITKYCVDNLYLDSPRKCNL